MIPLLAQVMGRPGRPILGPVASGRTTRRLRFPATIPETAPVAGENGAVVAVIAEIRVCRNAG